MTTRTRVLPAGGCGTSLLAGRHFTYLCMAVVLAGPPAAAQAVPAPATEPATAGATPRPAPAVGAAWSLAATVEDNKSDRGYATYKEGYALILDERWAQAREKFAALLKKYPKSDYADDAQYWTAYSLKYSDRTQAVNAYQKFLEAYPKSSYYDDALADLAALQPHAVVTPRPARTAPHAVPPNAGHNIAIAGAPNMRNLERQLKRQMRYMGRIGFEGVAPSPAVAHFGTRPDEKLDPSTRLKMDALYALGETTEDETSYSTLKDVAVDMRQPRPLREAAMDALSNFTKHDVVTVFVEIAKKDTNRDIQGYAIDFIGEHGSDKNQRVTVLAELFRTLPGSRTDQRRNIVYTIADVGNDRAVDFLKGVALGDDSYDLRRDAVYYLGNIGGEKSRTALLEILKGR